MFHFTVFEPTFERPLGHLPVGKACIFKTVKGFLVMAYRKSNDEMLTYVAKSNVDNTTPEEIAFSASHCCRSGNANIITFRGFFVLKRKLLRIHSCFFC